MNSSSLQRLRPPNSTSGGRPSSGQTSTSGRLIIPATAIKRPPSATTASHVPATSRKPIGYSRSSSIVSDVSSSTTVSAAGSASANRFSKEFRTPMTKITTNNGRLHANTASTASKMRPPFQNVATSTISHQKSAASMNRLSCTTPMHGNPAHSNALIAQRKGLTPAPTNRTSQNGTDDQNNRSMTVGPPATARKNFAKFSNPIECQRKFQAMTLKIQQLSKSNEFKDKDINVLQKRLEHSVTIGTGYAIIVQKFAQKLKLEGPIDLVQECENLKLQINELHQIISQQDAKFKATIDEHTAQQQELINENIVLQATLEEEQKKHSRDLERLNASHTEEVGLLNEKIAQLEEDIENKCGELLQLSQELTEIKEKYSTLEESLTKDSDFRMKRVKEKIMQLEKEVDSLNAVLNMRQERIHQLERENLNFIDCKNDLSAHKEVIKSLNQQLESVNAAFDRKREQYKKLLVENEQLQEALAHENQERQKVEMRTEQLEYSMTESCCQ